MRTCQANGMWTGSTPTCGELNSIICFCTCIFMTEQLHIDAKVHLFTVVVIENFRGGYLPCSLLAARLALAVAFHVDCCMHSEWHNEVV